MTTELLQRVPPQALEAEQSVLGGILIQRVLQDEDLVAAQARILSEITAIISADDFYREAHRQIFRAMLELAARKYPIDAITLTDNLRACGELELIGGPAYLIELASVVPTAANVGYYARTVRGKSVLRALAATVTAIASEAYDSPLEVRECVTAAEARISAIARLSLGETEPRMLDALRELLVSIEQGQLAGVATGFEELDRFLTTGGFSRGSLNVIAATTSGGKSALAGNIAVRGNRGGTLILSAEMTRDEILRRLIADLGSVDWSLIARRRPPMPDDAECKRIAQAMERIAAIPVEVRYRRRLTPADVRREGRLSLPDFDGKLDLIVVDYLQLMDPDSPQKRRDLEIAQITKELKNIAGELNVPILLLSQLNRQAVKTETGEPELWHLRESGAIEQDSDCVIFLWEARDQKVGPFGELIVNCKIAKQRNGPKVHLPALRFEREFTRFESRGGCVRAVA